MSKTLITCDLQKNINYPLKLKKIEACIYYDQTTNSLYRLQMFPKCVLFADNDVSNRSVMTFNQINPLYLMISLLYKKNLLNFNQIPQHLSKRNWQFISDKTTFGYQFNKQKVLDYLQRKVQQIQKFFVQNNVSDRIGVSHQQGQNKLIFPQTVNLLNNQLDQKIVKILCQQRYRVADNNTRKQCVGDQLQKYEAFKPRPDQKKKPANKKVQNTVPPKNQMTLFAFSSKKKEE